MVHAAYEYDGPVYIRLGRAAIPVFHDEENYKFEIGKAEILHEGTDICIISNGVLTYEALKAAETLEKEGIHARVLNMGTIKPIDAEAVVAAAKECGKIITAEEHSVIGGLGEAVCAVLAEKYPAPVRRIGLQDVFGYSGPMAQLMVEFGLDETNIVKTVKEFLAE